MRISPPSSSLWLPFCYKPCIALQPFPGLPKPLLPRCRRATLLRTAQRGSSSLARPIGDLDLAQQEGDPSDYHIPEEELQAVGELVIDHGIKSTMSQGGKLNSFYDVLHESDVLAPAGSKPRLVDNEADRHDFDLWTELLRFRARYKGHDGAWDIFEGMRARGVDLPTEGAAAAVLWDTIVVAALKLSKSREIWQYSFDLHARTGQRYTKLYSLIIGSYTPLKWQYALQSHERFSVCESTGSA